ncbi:hypothetical protein PS1_003812 [Malus domestica]
MYGLMRLSGQGYGSIIPDASGAESHSLTKILAERIGIYVDQYIEAMAKESEFWQLYKQDQASCSLVIKTSAGLIYLLACLPEPFMPSFSLKKDEDVEFFRKKFSGSQAERVAKGEAEANKMAEKLDETKN